MPIKQIFLSSTSRDLAKYRAAVIAATKSFVRTLVAESLI